MDRKEKREKMMKNSNLRTFAKGAPLVFTFVVIVLFGINQLGSYISAQQDRADRNTRIELKEASYEDFFNYIDVKPIKDSFKVGEPLKFESTRVSNGVYNITFVDRIICPELPRTLVATAVSQGFTKGLGFENEVQTIWTFGNFTPGTDFVVKTIQEPQTDCTTEHFITAEVAPGEFKTQLFVAKHKFDIVE